jgi:hypothetical protein
LKELILSSRKPHKHPRTSLFVYTICSIYESREKPQATRISCGGQDGASDTHTRGDPICTSFLASPVGPIPTLPDSLFMNSGNINSTHTSRVGMRVKQRNCVYQILTHYSVASSRNSSTSHRVFSGHGFEILNIKSPIWSP